MKPNFWYSNSAFVLIFVSITLAAAILVLACIGVGERLALPAGIAKIEQLRCDLAKVRNNESEDTVGQATHWNQIIREKQAYNRTWWADVFIPDAWNSVEILDISREDSK